MQAEHLKKFLEYAPDTGLFRWKLDAPFSHRRLRNRVAGWRSDRAHSGYVHINVLGQRYHAHDLAFYFMMGRWPHYSIDHINGVRNDNRWKNLREATLQENAFNAAISKGNATGFKGVSFYKRTGKFRAYIKVSYVEHHLGYFDTPLDAARAYNDAATRFFGEFARLNKIALSAIAFLLLFTADGFSLTVCATKPPKERSGYWAYRLVENRPCWYRGRAGRDKRLLTWARQPAAPMADEPLPAPPAPVPWPELPLPPGPPTFSERWLCATRGQCR